MAIGIHTIFIRGMNMQTQKKGINAMFAVSLALIFIEFSTRIFVFGVSFDSGVYFNFVAALFFGFLECYLISFAPEKAQFPIAASILGFKAVYHSFQIIYHSFFAMFFSYEMLTFAGAAAKDFAGNIVYCTLQCLPKVIVLFIPLLALLFTHKKFTLDFPRKGGISHKLTGLIATLLAILFLLTALLPKNPRKTLIYMRNDNAETFRRFGMVIGTADDIFQTVFGAPEEVIDAPNEPIWQPPTEIPEDFALRVTLKIDPGFNIFLDERENVLYIDALDADAESFISEINYENALASEVTEQIVLKSIEKGFIMPDSEIDIAIAKHKDSPAAKEDIASISDALKTKIEEILAQNSITATVKARVVKDISSGDEQETEYGFNELGIDFDALIKNAPDSKIKDMHEYFKNVEPSKKNEYTGMFEGKNLIFITLEGFSYKVIDKDRTPTLYKMYNEGFKFTNFYNSTWGGSTASGEYANMTGNFYKSANCLKKSGSTRTYSSLGQLFKSQGYSNMAYHNHTYNYYDRDVSHPNFGYTYKAIKNGLKLPSEVWPNSDYEMAQVTGPEYISKYLKDKVPFHTYYMSVSGHANYTFAGNTMSARHRDITEDLPYSSGIKAYIACQYEVEMMLYELVRQLDEAGILDDTVFALSADHYPFGLSDEDLATLYGLENSKVRGNLDLYRNAFILWSSSMEEPVEIGHPCSTYDIVPTIANLFGIPYESRIITGTDILSTKDNIAIINPDQAGGAWSWATKYGRYNTATKVFTPSDEWTFGLAEVQNYVNSVNNTVSAMKKYSWAILDNDYYKYVFDAKMKPLSELKGES